MMVVMVGLKQKVKAFVNNRWLVFVCAMWVQSCAGIGYLFGSISPVIKSTMGYDQRQLALLGVAKDLGDSIGFLAGSLCELLPIWALMLIGVVQNFLGYGVVWLVITQKIPTLPLWLMCLCIFVGTNGETYFNTGALIAGVQNFPKNRGPIVGILKGFAGLSGAILTQIYTMLNAPNASALVFMVVVGPSMVVLALMFIVRPVGGHKQNRPFDSSGFLFTFSLCLVLAAYLLGVLLLEDLLGLSHALITLLTILLIIIILLPVAIPITLVFFSGPVAPSEEAFLPDPQKQEPGKSEQDGEEVILSEVEDEKPVEVDTLPASERNKRIAQLQAKLFQAAAEGAVRVKKRRPRRGEDFTLRQALVKADFWLIFISLVLASGSGLTIIDNMGQICQSLGYTNTSIFVSMLSIWNFLGRVGGGYFSEIIVRNLAFPRPVSMAIFQVLMAFGLLYYSLAWPGAIYVVSIFIGLGYGAHWAIVPAAASELFGLKSFGALYNFLTLSSSIGTLLFSGVIASGIYDYYADKQSGVKQQQGLGAMAALALGVGEEESLSCEGSICYSLTCGILSGLCLVAVVLSLILVYRTKSVYANIYGRSQA